MDTILFIIFAIVAIVCAFNLVLQKHPISSALSLIGVMGSLAVLYLLLGAEFIAMAQMIVYGGAVMVLFIFVIMLLNAGTEKASDKSWFAQIAGLPLLLAFVAVIAFLIRSRRPRHARWCRVWKLGRGHGAKRSGSCCSPNICCRLRSSRS